jgi:hypothetical protein
LSNPPCICLDVFTEAAFGRVDREAWIVEYEQYVLHGHVASCHHQSPTRQHRIFARILNDMLSEQETFGR